ncbi:class I SAM-dependent methyltransferase [Sporosarcina limicola]|uniref:Phospholipid N-methyltransferase n=1 Tax=Sporosarcina limicola TaxID=34101 RepID=A0A927MFW2_9BACL|nr:rRNA adenine N-6-methyltransferase family protein [Sporosarcina limicola]MBE1553939.1 phospholipid N-methyltransferase [Sporosarcina limicola]
MQILKFLKEYIKHPRNTGAVAASTPRLARGMVSGIDFDTATCIVEIGPGMGSFTREIMKRKKPNTFLLLIEINEVFYTILKKQYKDNPSVQVVNGSAENIEKYLLASNFNAIDYCISGLPFASLPKEVSTKILNSVMELLKPNGKFVTFQYSLVKLSFIKKHFSEISVEKVWFNLPPAYVLSCSNEMVVQ